MKSNLNFLCSSLLFLIFSISCGGCDGCSDKNYLSDLGFKQEVGSRDDMPSFNDPDLSFEVCNDRCLEKKTDRRIASVCEIECEQKRKALGFDTEICPAKCEQVVERAANYVKLECHALCFDDNDRDGVANAVDKCPGSKDDRVNWFGCVDSDLDGVPDTDDDCPSSKKDEKVNVKGCSFVAHCHEGNCSTTFPKCSNKEECDRQLERPLTRQIPEDIRRKWIQREVGKKSFPINCPTEKSSPGQPVLSLPGQGINRVETGKVRIAFQNDKIIEGPTHKLEFQWDPIEDACKPVTYAVLIESYHCHHIRGVVEPDSYFNRGWCKWQAVTYASNIENTAFSYEFEIGKHLLGIHRAFERELNFSTPSDGSFEMSFHPFWLRARVLSIDGNGSASASGMHSDHRYFVFYNSATTTPEQLVNIPIGP